MNCVELPPAPNVQNEEEKNTEATNKRRALHELGAQILEEHPAAIAQLAERLLEEEQAIEEEQDLMQERAEQAMEAQRQWELVVRIVQDQTQRALEELTPRERADAIACAELAVRVVQEHTQRAMKKLDIEEIPKAPQDRVNYWQMRKRGLA
jgi:hypothetical protein